MKSYVFWETNTKKEKEKKKGFNKMTHYKPYSKFMIDFKERYIANYITYDKHIL